MLYLAGFESMTKNIFLSLFASLLMASAVVAQPEAAKENQRVRTVSIPISIFTKEELRQGQAEEFVQADRLIVKEDKDEQTILSIRSVVDAPLALAILVQDDLSSSFNLQIKDIKKFIRKFAAGLAGHGGLHPRWDAAGETDGSRMTLTSQLNLCGSYRPALRQPPETPTIALSRP